jgi:hypothetical protein
MNTVMRVAGGWVRDKVCLLIMADYGIIITWYWHYFRQYEGGGVWCGFEEIFGK